MLLVVLQPLVSLLRGFLLCHDGRVLMHRTLPTPVVELAVQSQHNVGLLLPLWERDQVTGCLSLLLHARVFMSFENTGALGIGLRCANFFLPRRREHTVDGAGWPFIHIDDESCLLVAAVRIQDDRF